MLRICFGAKDSSDCLHEWPPMASWFEYQTSRFGCRLLKLVAVKREAYQPLHMFSPTNYVRRKICHPRSAALNLEDEGTAKQQAKPWPARCAAKNMARSNPGEAERVAQ